MFENPSSTHVLWFAYIQCFWGCFLFRTFQGTQVRRYVANLLVGLLLGLVLRKQFGTLLQRRRLSRRPSKLSHIKVSISFV